MLWFICLRKEAAVYKKAGYFKCFSSKANSIMDKTRSLVGVAQMTSTNDKESNFKQLETLVERAHKEGVKMVFLPECCDYVAESREQTLSLAEGMDGELIKKYKELSKRYQLWLSIGGFHKKAPDLDGSHVYNSNIVLNSEGEVVSEYKKIHLFDFSGSQLRHPSRESSHTKAGDGVVAPVDTPIGKLGQCICYDLRFPEMSTLLREMGADVIAYPSAFTIPTGMAHWETLLRSRAIETQCYILAPAQVGVHDHKRASYGHSMIVDPWGKVLAECRDDRPDLCVAEIDFEFLAKVRINMPIIDHRRKDLYSSPANFLDRLEIDAQELYDFGKNKIRNSSVFLATKHSFAFVNISPIIQGHVLVASRRKVPRLENLSAEEVADVFLTVQVVSKVVEGLFAANSLTVSIQDGKEAGQTVEHLHVHVLPRKPGDFKVKDDIFKELERHDKDEGRVKRSEEVMTSEAKSIREALENSGCFSRHPFRVPSQCH